MSRHATRLLCPLCTCSPVPLARAPPIAQIRSLATTSATKRAPRAGGPRPRYEGRRQPQNEFKLSSDVPVAADLLQYAKKDVLQELRAKAQELAGERRGNMTQIIDALAKRLGLDSDEMHKLAERWANGQPFTLGKDLQTSEKGFTGEGFDSVGIVADMKTNGPRAIERAVLSYFLRWLRAQVEIGKLKMSPQLASIVEALDLRYPGEWFPSARAQKRKLILHVGPTNSGKTYNALCALAKARSGAFAGPLRLLATEVYNRFNAGTIGGLTPDSPRICNLITGEEKKIHDPLAGLESCTVEMMSMTRTFDVVVIDEIQMIGNPDRGSAWTNALLGIKANEIHLCGEPSVVDLIKRIGKTLGDEVEVREYERLSPLRVADRSLNGDLTQIRKGDCVVTFSRNNIFAVKKMIEEQTGLKVAVAYGGLPPEVREEQARGFNASGEQGGYDVMVASDAIGMGLNLAIKRIIFETMHKWDGKQAVELSVSQIKQIGGRAGRFGVNTASASASGPDELDPEKVKQEATPAVVDDPTNGVVTCLDEEDMPILRKAMQAPMEPIKKAALHPTSVHLEDFTSLLPSSTTQAHVFEIFPVIASASSDYFVPAFGGALKLSSYLKDIPNLTVSERWQLGNSPVNTRNPEAVGAFVDFATNHANHRVTQITEWQEKHGMADFLEQFRAAEGEVQYMKQLRPDDPNPTSRKAKKFATSSNLVALESLHRCFSLYLWLHNRGAILFPQIAEARLLKVEVQEAIDFILSQMSFQRKSLRGGQAEKAVGGHVLRKTRAPTAPGSGLRASAPRSSISL